MPMPVQGFAFTQSSGQQVSTDLAPRHKVLGGMSRSVLIIEAAVGGFDVQAAASESSIEAVCSA